MNKTQLDRRIMKAYYFRKPNYVKGISDIIIEQISNTLELGKRIEVRGFGAWFLVYALNKNYRNPKTGEPFIKKHCFKFRFKASPVLNNRVDNVVNKDRKHKEEPLGVLPTVPEPLVDTPEDIGKAIEEVKKVVNNTTENIG